MTDDGGRRTEDGGRMTDDGGQNEIIQIRET